MKDLVKQAKKKPAVEERKPLQKEKRLDAATRKAVREELKVWIAKRREVEDLEMQVRELREELADAAPMAIAKRHNISKSTVWYLGRLRVYHSMEDDE